MKKYRWDYSAISANKASSSKTVSAKVECDYGIYKCLIIKVNYVDQTSNLTVDNKQVTYDAIIVSGGPKEGLIIKNIKTVNTLGGQYNYSEKIFRASRSFNTPNVTNKPRLINTQDGDIVYVAFVNGIVSHPIILGGGVSYLDKDTTGATTEIGPIFKTEYNGVLYSIDKNGQFSLVRKTGTYDADYDAFIPSDDSNDFQAKLVFEANKILIADPENSLLFEQAEQRITQVIGSDNLYKEVIDGKNQKTTRTYKNGLKVEESGAGDFVRITTNGGTVVTINGSTGKVTISADQIDLGASITDLVTKFMELASAFNSHRHPYEEDGDTKITQAPIGPLSMSIGSSTVRVQD